MRRSGEPCILEERLCIECRECDHCEIEPSKICDNCGDCIDEPKGDYLEIIIDDILLNTDELIPKPRQSYSIKKRT